MRPPKGAWMMSCMPPPSSKKRSAMMVVLRGNVTQHCAAGHDVFDELARPPESSRPHSSFSQATVFCTSGLDSMPRRRDLATLRRSRPGRLRLRLQDEPCSTCSGSHERAAHLEEHRLERSVCAVSPGGCTLVGCGTLPKLSSTGLPTGGSGAFFASRSPRRWKLPPITMSGFSGTGSGAVVGSRVLNCCAQVGHVLRQLIRPRWSLAPPERNRRRRAMRVFYQHATGVGLHPH